MRATRNLIQAYHQAPWRRQVQFGALVLGTLAVLALIAAIYLNVTSRAATTGRQVQQMQDARQDLEQEIEDLQTQLAYITSIEVMQLRAEKLGFEPVSPAEVTFLTVTGYQGQIEAQLAPHPSSQFGTAVRLPAAYTMSLFEWLGALFGGGR